MHHRRRFNVKSVTTSEELAKLVTQQSWTLCAGFRFGGYLWVNDSTSEDGATEFAVFHEETGRQCESLTFGWMNESEALDAVLTILSGGNGYAREQIAKGKATGNGLPVHEDADARTHECDLCA